MSGRAWGWWVLSGVVWAQIVAQAGAGGIGFGWFADRVVGFPLEPAAELGFRLASASNLCAAGMSAVLLVRGRGLGEIAAAGAVYHLIAAWIAWEGVRDGGPLVQVGTSAGPFHAVAFVILALGLAAGAWSASARRSA